MSSKEQIEIDYLERKTKVPLPPKYSEFIKTCKETFYLSDLRLNLMSIKYINEKGKELNIDQKNYKNEDTLKAKYWKLVFDDDDDEDDNDEGDKNALKSIKNDMINTKNSLIMEIKNFKKKLYEEYVNKAKVEIKKKNEEFKKIYTELKLKYDKDIEELEKLKNDTFSKNTLNLINFFKESIESGNQSEKDELSKQLNDFKEELGNEFNDVKIDEIKEEVKEMGGNVMEFMNKINNQIFSIKPEKNAITINNIRGGVKFNLNIKNISKETITGNYILEITFVDKMHNIDLNISELKSNETQNKEISFKPEILKKGDYESNLIIKNKEGMMFSNPKKLYINIVEEGLIGELLN